MENQKKAFFSNKIESLLANLKNELFLDKNFSLTRVVVVPSKHIKNWIMQKIAEDDKFQIFCLMKFVEISQLDAFFSEYCWRGDKKLPSFLELSLMIEKEIEQLLASSDETGLLNFLQPESGSSKKLKRRIRTLSDDLSSLFLIYGVFGINLDFNSDTWQMKIWRKIFQDKWSFPINEIKEAICSKKIQIHCFGLTFLPKLYCNFLEKVSFVNFYFISPSMHYWEDSCSKDEKKSIKKFFSRKNDSLEKLNALDDFLDDTNPLLANLGKIQKEFLKNINQDSFETFEDYHDLCEEWNEGNNFINIPLLTAIKQDLLYLRAPKEKYLIKNDINSVQIHEAANKKREIEILYDFVLKELSYVKPEDITVYCPDIKEYEPYIHLVFSANDSPVNYKISDIEVASKSFFVQGIVDLLSLTNNRFDAKTILNLFSNSSFLNKHQFSNEDFLMIKQWVENANINWGLDSKHFEKFKVGINSKSWERGLDRLLNNFVYFYDKEDFSSEEINFSDFSLFDKFLRIFFEIKKDIQIFENNELNLHEWQKALKDVIFKNFLIEEKDEIERSAAQSLERFFNKMIEAFQARPNEVFSFDTIFYFLKEGFHQTTTAYNSSQTNAVHFRKIGSVCPSKIICILGLDEGFPQFQPHNSLNLLKEKNVYLPTRYDEEKFLFLQALLFSENIFYLSYVSTSPLDGKKQGPSSLIQELLSYIKDSYNIDDFSSIVRKHPMLGFDKKYFSKDLYSFSRLNEKAAKKYYFKDELPRIFINELYNKAQFTNENSLPDIIFLDNLRSLSSNPIKFYFNQVLGLYLEKEKEDQEMKDFVLNYLDKFIIYKKLFENSCFETQQLDIFFKELEDQGRLPLGLMKKVCIDDIRGKAKEYFENFKKLGLQNIKVLDVEFKQSNFGIKEEENKISLPPYEIKVEGKTIKLVGKLSNISEKGLINLNDDKFFNLIKLWPDCLVFLKLQKELNFEKNILFLKTGVEKKLHDFDVDLALEKYLQYYNRCLTHSSPLIKDWAEALLLDNEKMQKSIKKSIDIDDYIDPYFRWAVGSFDIPKAPAILENWASFLNETFKPLLEFCERI